VQLQPNMKLPFTYEVTWKPTSVPFSKRFDKYLDPGFFQHKVDQRTGHRHLSTGVIQIHWFSIFNSFMMVLFLVGLVSMILLRTLRKDYARYDKDDDLNDMVGSIACACCVSSAHDPMTRRRNEIWVTSTDGSKSTETFSVRRLIPFCSLH
jgi:hypothetical protein